MVESLGPRCLVRTLVYMELSMCIRSADQTARPVSRTLLPCLLLSLQILTGCQSPNTHDGWIHRNYKDYTHSYGSMKETGINSDFMSLVPYMSGLPLGGVGGRGSATKEGHSWSHGICVLSEHRGCTPHHQMVPEDPVLPLPALQWIWDHAQPFKAVSSQICPCISQ